LSRAAGIALVLVASALVGCDPGPHTDQATVTGPPVHLVATNLRAGLPSNDTIQLAFDRLLLPSSITRQTFQLSANPPPEVTYDPVTRVVRVIPATPLIVGQSYQLAIALPQSSTDPNGLRAIDGALGVFGAGENPLNFTVGPPTAPAAPQPPVDFCADVQPILSGCGTMGCHSAAPLAAAGLALDTPADIAATAVGRVAIGANTGPQALPMPPGRLFGEDMPIIDPGSGGAGNASNSWMMYKLLMSVPTPDSSGGGDAGVDGATEGGVEGGMSGGTLPVPLEVPWQPLSSSERAILAGMVQGREMPYPGPTAQPLTTVQLETLSAWIAQGATIPAGCP
jgi:hypothetical protein